MFATVDGSSMDYEVCHSCCLFFSDPQTVFILDKWSWFSCVNSAECNFICKYWNSRVILAATLRWFTAGGCNPHRCTTTFANVEITSFWRHQNVI